MVQASALAPTLLSERKLFSAFLQPDHMRVLRRKWRKCIITAESGSVSNSASCRKRRSYWVCALSHFSYVTLCLCHITCIFYQEIFLITAEFNCASNSASCIKRKHVCVCAVQD